MISSMCCYREVYAQSAVFPRPALTWSYYLACDKTPSPKLVLRGSLKAVIWSLCAICSCKSSLLAASPLPSRPCYQPNMDRPEQGVSLHLPTGSFNPPSHHDPKYAASFHSGAATCLSGYLVVQYVDTLSPDVQQQSSKGLYPQVALHPLVEGDHCMVSLTAHLAD